MEKMSFFSNKSQFLTKLRKVSPKQYPELVINQQNILFCWGISLKADRQLIQSEMPSHIPNYEIREWIWIPNKEYGLYDAFIVLGDDIIITSSKKKTVQIKNQKVS